MARVNHKKVRQLISQKRKTITDRQFFSSRLLAGHFEDMAVAQTRRYTHSRRVKVRLVWEPKKKEVAYTDNGLIWINAGHQLVTGKRKRIERYDIVCGLFAHELGHVLYTDFLAMQSYALSIQSGRWFPLEPLLKNHDERVNAAEILEYIKSDPKRMVAFLQLAHNINNILEDGFIESRILNRYPGVLGYSLEAARLYQYELQPTLTQLIENEPENGHIWMSIMQLILSYVKYGELKYGEEPLTDERIQVVFALLDELDRALMESSAKERWSVTNTILVRCWPYIKDFLELCEKLAEEAEATSDGSGIGGILGALLSALKGSSGEAKGDSSPIEEPPSGSPPPTSAPAKRAATAVKAAASLEVSDDSADGEENPEEAGSVPIEDSDSKDDAGDDGASSASTEGSDSKDDAGDDGASSASAEDSDSKDDTGDDGTSDDKGAESEESTPAITAPTVDADTVENGASGDAADTPDTENDEVSIGDAAEGSSSKAVSADEGGRIPLSQTDDLSSPSGGETDFDDGYAGSGYAHSADDIERLLENMAEKAVAKELETQRTSELNDLANSISYGNIHTGVHKVVHRLAEVDDDMKEQYHTIAAPLLHISKQLQRSVSQQLKDKRKGGKQTGLLMGRRLDAHALSRNDGRVFYKNALPNEAPELCVGLLLDESGSMCCAERATYARATAIILYDFCRGLGIPVMVYGHTTTYPRSDQHLDLYSYAEFDEIDGNDRYRLMDITARSDNRDGAALRFVAERLVKRPEDVKILAVVSDGQPAASGYYGTAAEEDMRGVKREYAKKGILFVAAAIGNDKENIERIYGDSFLDITDLNKLPTALTNVVKRHIRV